MNTKKLKFLQLLFLVLPFTLYLLPCVSQTLAPNAPGKDAQWATAGKQGVGSSASLNSKVWFTLAQGVMTEVYFPDVTVANTHLLQFAVVNPKTKKVETEFDDAIHQIKVLRPDSLSFQQINTAKSGAWKITKTYTTDIERDSILIDVQFESKNKNLNLYVYFDPSLGNSGMGDRAYSPLVQMEAEIERQQTEMKKEGVQRDKIKRKAIVSSGLGSDDGEYSTALVFSSNIDEFTNGYYGVNDGMEQLRKFGKIVTPFSEAKKGNVVQMAKIKEPQRFTAVLGLAKDTNYNILTAAGNASKSLQKGFVKAKAEYEKEWAKYVAKLPKVEPKYQAQFNMAAMQLKIHEDKTVRGANIASLTVPWGGGDNANVNNIGGYHLIWSRDLYQVATAFMAIGDKEAAIRALNFLLKVQQKEDGSFPQNSYLDGRPFWGSLQLDEVAYPLILAHELGVHDKETYQKHIKLAADFIVKNGPITPQERWEEESGYSPSTIAAEIAGLVCAAEIAKKNGDNESANRWLKTADEWAANIEKWTVTRTGKYSKEPYYLRITQGKPDSGEKLELNNGAGFFDERDIVDAGFLELVRLGIKPANDPIIQNSLKVIDQIIRVKTPNGDGFYRYNHDGYGEMDDGRRWNWDGKYTGKGRLWALLSGERGQFEVAGCDAETRRRGDVEKGGNLRVSKGENACLENAKQRLDAMSKFANDGLMIPEQVWDSPKIPKNADKQFVPELKFGEGTGSATPLAWSMAQFIRLAVNLKEGRNLDTPKVVYNRYVLERKDFPKVQISETEFLERFLINKGNGSFSSPTSRRDPKSPEIFVRKGETETMMMFSYIGNESSVQIVGDFTNWKPYDLMKFQKFDGYSVKILKFPNSARIEYKLIVDGKWITDPLNPNKVDNGVGGENSFFTMPDYKPTTWDSPASINVQSLEEFEIDSKVYGEKRKIQVLGPMANEIRTTFYPVLYLQDGGDYLNRANAVSIEQNLLKAGKIQPFLIVFLNPKDRMKEYWANDDYAKFLAEEVVPFIDGRYNTIKNRDGRAVMGASLGGITAVHVGLKYPKIFGRIGGQSSSFWIDNKRVVKELEKLDGKTKFTFYFDDGTLEGVEDSRKVVEILKGKCFAVTYIEGEAGHNWTAWRDRLADAFVALWK